MDRRTCYFPHSVGLPDNPPNDNCELGQAIARVARSIKFERQLGAVACPLWRPVHRTQRRISPKLSIDSDVFWRNVSTHGDRGIETGYMEFTTGGVPHRSRTC